MNARKVSDLMTPIGEILQGAERGGVLLEPAERSRYAVLPLNDDLIDYLLEHNPELIEDCRRIRADMKAGRFHTHDEVKKMLEV